MRYLRATAVILLVVADAVAIVAGVVLSATAHWGWSLLAIGAASLLAVAAWWQHRRIERTAASAVARPITVWPHVNPPRRTETGDHK